MLGYIWQIIKQKFSFLRLRKNIYIASKLKNEEQQKLNDKIYLLCKKIGFKKIFAPQRKTLPYENKLSPNKILSLNRGGVDGCDIFLLVFDRCSSGSAMEYERAFLLKKCIIGFRTKRSLKEDDLGKMVEGAWSDIQHKASTLQELRKILFEI